ncbi:hypothetical protein SNE40_009298 [Patella caerulea]|uniref:Integrase catalytic domain-containing protein n=1 Tax=Patella caerulea TaxID=87958 RepID=A0AAN8PQ24_PATCE
MLACSTRLAVESEIVLCGRNPLEKGSPDKGTDLKVSQRDGITMTPECLEFNHTPCIDRVEPINIVYGSRGPRLPPINIEVSALLEKGHLTKEELSCLQSAELALNDIMKRMKQGVRPSWEEIAPFGIEVKHYWSMWNLLTLENNIFLYKKWVGDNDVVTWLIVLPWSLRVVVLDQLHDSPTGGHLGALKTLEKVRSRYYWYEMKKDIEYYCHICDICARNKVFGRHPKAPLKLYVAGAPMERIALDILGPLTRTHKRNRFLLVVGDYFTKWSDAYPIRDQEARTIASKLIDRFVALFGVPMLIHTDQGLNFDSALFKEVCTILGSNKTRTTNPNRMAWWRD